MLIATDSSPSPFFLYVYGIWQTNLHRQHQGNFCVQSDNMPRSRRGWALQHDNGWNSRKISSHAFFFSPASKSKTNQQINNEEINVCSCARKHIQREAWDILSVQKGGDVILTSARHSPTMTTDFVRMRLVVEQGWINSIWHGDGPWPFRMRRRRTSRRNSLCCGGGWATHA